MTYKRKETIGDCTLYLGDCQDIVPTLDGVDGCFMDPPYEKEAHRKDRRVQKKDGLVAGALTFDMMTPEIRQKVCDIVENKLHGWFIAFCQAEGVAPWRDCIETAGMKYKSPMVWIKPDGMPKFCGDGPGMGYESMVAAWSGGGRSKWNGGGRHGTFTFPKGEGKKPVHETQKPVRLMKELVRLFSNEGELILDCFMGSGTTGVACAKMGRKFIGIEQDEKYFDIACGRIREAYKQPDLFIEAPKEEEQTGLDL